MDVRDLSHTLTHREWTYKWGETLAFNTIGLIPLIGVIKNLKNAKNLKYLDDAGELAKRTDDAADAAGDAGRRGVGADEAATNRAEAGAENTVRRAPAPDNYRGRFNADRNAQGLPRFPDDYDAHHRIPQEFKDHPDFQDFDFHEPGNIQGVKGSRSDVNTHQLITNDWADFRRINPNATRSQIEAFAEQIDTQYSKNWFQ